MATAEGPIGLGPRPTRRAMAVGVSLDTPKFTWCKPASLQGAGTMPREGDGADASDVAVEESNEAVKGSSTAAMNQGVTRIFTSLFRPSPRSRSKPPLTAWSSDIVLDTSRPGSIRLAAIASMTSRKSRSV